MPKSAEICRNLPPFIVFALPRSRTAWASAFLTYGGWFCGHDEARRLRNLEDMKAWFSQPMTGSVETAAAPWWRLLPEGVRVATIRRPVHEVANSLTAFGVDPLVSVPALKRLDAKLDQIEKRLGALSVSYDELGTEAGCASLFEYCLSLPHDPSWWSSISAVNIQHPMHAMARYAEAYRGQLDKLAKTATATVKANLAARKPVTNEGVSLQVEPFETFIEDARNLIADHLVRVGEPPDSLDTKNLPLMQTLSDMGAMQVVTARSNGRMFGYLMTIISPSLENRDMRSAIETTFYASSDMPGLGLKLQRFSLEKLRQENRADEIVFRAGPRGSGPKMGTMYKRLGALPDGELFRLNLRAN